MNIPSDAPYRPLSKASKKQPSGPSPPAGGAPLHHHPPAGPTTFFLRSEREVDNKSSNAQPRGRTTLRETSGRMQNASDGSPDVVASAEDASVEALSKLPPSAIEGSMFGVQSLEETIASSEAHEMSLSRATSRSSGMGISGHDALSSVDDSRNSLASRKRKAGNPVHPKILATGQRILSSEVGTGSPSSLRSIEAESLVGLTQRRNSVSSTSPFNASQPLTPLRMSPQRAETCLGTPRSGSPKSFRLSDEEASIASETESQAVASSDGGEEEEERLEEGAAGEASRTSMPQLVMPSLAMPSRRPFTERGRRIGKLKVLVVGGRGVGKTSLIHSICRVCNDIVHLDAVDDVRLVDGMRELGASTRPYPSWWTDFEARRSLSRRKSLGDGILERNVTFVDACSDEDGIESTLRYFKASLQRTASLESLSDADMIGVLSGEGGVQVDVVIYVFGPASSSAEDDQTCGLDAAEMDLLSFLCKWTNVVPVISRVDTVEADGLASRRKELSEMFVRLDLESYSAKRAGLDRSAASQQTPPLYVISSALGDDTDIIEASVLMASSYLQPLITSDLDDFVRDLFEPENAARLRHLSAAKFLLWRQQHLSIHVARQMQRAILSPRYCSDEAEGGPEESTSSLLHETSKVLVPHASSSYYRSASPASVSETSASISISSSPADASNNSVFGALVHAPHDPPYRHLRLAKWASDLQRSLDHERQRYRAWYHHPNQPSNSTSSPPSPSFYASNGDQAMTHNDPNTALLPLFPPTTASDQSHHSLRPPKGHLGGALSIIDPRDPLGLLALQRRSWILIRFVGASAAIYWALQSLWPQWWSDCWSFATGTSSQSATPSAGGARISVLGVPPSSSTGSSSTGSGSAGSSASGAFGAPLGLLGSWVDEGIRRVAGSGVVR